MSTPRTKARTFLGRLARDKAGNTLVMMTMFIIPILLMAGTAVDGARVYFDTNVSDHHHFLIEDSGELQDIHGATVALGGNRVLREFQKSVGG